ncbi:LPS-assembly protein LptD [Geothrix alkalitolerans]|uniref:LPS-assembly protein LptD n=1 Tax=Geothrix alkalitolerans TaxID=2922724 RepID=UPI001FAEBC9E|nr:putative LPS assembly protein LptD [Geothrix alkalitolerans]
MLGAVQALLAAQGLPDLPQPLPLDAPTPAELLPLRPFRVDRGPGLARVPFDYRGEGVFEEADVWTLEQGAIQSEGLLLLADRIRYHIPDGRLVAEGHIRLEGPGLRLRGERLEMDWERRSGQAWALQMDLPPSWTLRSSHVAFTTLRTWAFDAVELSPCPEEKPGWKARLSSLKVDLDGFASMWNARVLLGAVPIYYVPYALYPAQAERTSGLLPPKIGMSSAFGTTLGLSYYQVMGDSVDATLSPEYFTKEGVLWGGEARWRPDLTHQGSFSGQTIHQKSLDERRYRYSLKEVWQREDGWQLTADVNQASDNLVDADFGKGIGYLGATSFDSAIYLGRTYTFGNLNLSAAEQRSFFYTKDQGDPFYSPDFPASLRRQTLPQAEFRFFPVSLVGPLYLDGGVRVGRFAYRIEGSATAPADTYAWDRQDANARIHGRLGQWGPFRADFEAMGRATHYSASLGSSVFDPEGGATDTVVNPATSPFQVDGAAATRFLGSGHLRLSGPQVGRTFKDVSLLGYKGELKHVAEPYFGWTQTSLYGEAGRLPRFDSVDAFPGVNESASGERSFEVGLKQHIFGRPGPGTGFADLARLRIATRYHASPIILSDGRYKKGWSSVDTDLDVEPDERLRISLRRSSDLGAGGSDNALSMDFKVKDGSRFNLAYFSTGINRFLVRQKGLQAGGVQRFWDDRLRLEFSANYDFHMSAFASSQVALAYVEPCVAYVLKYTHVALNTNLVSGGREDRIDLTLTLRGLGDLFSFRR